MNPDADALGSMLGLSNHLRGLGTQTVCSFPNDPFEPPRWASMLPGTDALVPPSAFPNDPAVMVTCDVGVARPARPRWGARGARDDADLIDHHVTNEGLGTIPIIDPSASSTCELVWRLAEGARGEIRVETAMCLYAGLGHRHRAVPVRGESGRTRSAWRRSSGEFPFDHTRLVQALYEDHGVAYLELLGIVLERVRVEPDADLVWTYLTRADLTRPTWNPGDADDLIDLVRTAREADVAAVVKQQRDGRFKVSLRSRGGHDARGRGRALRGGGHRLASGYTSSQGLVATVESLKDALGAEPRPGPSAA